MTTNSTNSVASNEQKRDRLVKKFAYEYVRFNHDPGRCYLVADVTNDCMLEVEGMSGQFAPSCFNLAPQPKQEPTTGADGRYCAHHDDDPAHGDECYEPDTTASNQQLEPCTWKDCDQIARHPRTDSYGRVWSNVCDAHDALMKQAAIDAFESKGQRGTERLVAMWVKAQGGAKKAAERAIGRRTHE